MRALQIVEYGRELEMRDVALPTPSGEQVLVRVTHCGLCHSDLHMQDGFFDRGTEGRASIAGLQELPFTLGHEIEGEIVELGPDVRLPYGLSVGSKCAVYPWIGCGECPACARGQEHLCSAQRALGIQSPGGFSEFCLIPSARYLISAEGLSPGRGGMCMCSGLTAFSALRRTALAGTSEPLLIVGAGGLGLTAVSLARALMDRAPAIADTSQLARAAALSAGAYSTIDPDARGAVEQAMSDTADGYAAVIDFVGSTESVAFSAACARRGGQVIVVGLFGGMVSMPTVHLPFHALRLEGSYVGSLDEAHELLGFIRSRHVSETASVVVPLSQGAAAMERLRARKIVGRVILDASA